MDSNKEGSREQGNRNLGAGSTKDYKGEQGAGRNEIGNGARSKRNCQGARGKNKKEQGAKLVKKLPKNRREQGKWGKMLKGAGGIEPP